MNKPFKARIGSAPAASAAVHRNVRIHTRLSLAHSLLVYLLIAATCGLSAWHVGTYLTIVRQRMFYPYALEWMEGGSLEHVARVLEAKPLYVEPSLDFTPFIYSPLYYWVCAPFAWLFGLRLSSLRMVSFLASAAILWLLFGIVWKRTRNVVASVAAVGMFAAAFEVCAGFYDLARVDSLALFWLLLGIFLLRRHDAWAGLCFAAAFLTKQSTALVAVPVLAARCITQVGARRLYAAGVCGIVTLGVCVIADRASGGAFRYYVFTLPKQHPWYPASRQFWSGDIFANVPFACAAALYLLTELRPWRAQLELWAAGLGCLAAAWVLRLHVGGAANVLMPLLAFLAWSLGEALHRSSRLARGGAALSWPRRRAFGSTSSLFGLGLCVVQLSWLLYTPRSHLPSSGDRKAGDALVAYLRTIEGPILVLFDPNLARLARRTGSAHQQAMADVGLGHDQRRTDALQADIVQALTQRRYAAIVTNGSDWHPQELHAGYVMGPTQLPTASTPEGMPCCTNQVWLRRAKR